MRKAVWTRDLAVAVAFGLVISSPARSQAPADPYAEGGFITTSDGVRLHYLEAGSGPSLLFVPGWTMPAEIWEEQIRHFSESYRVIALDPRSQGRSEKVTEGHFPERRARDIHEAVEQLGLAPAVLVGWSLAVSELLTYVDRFGTESIRALVLVDGYIGADPEPGGADPLVAMMKGLLEAVHENRQAFTAAFVRSMYRTERSEEYLTRITDAAMQTPTNTAFTLLAHSALIDGDWRPALDELDRPLLYVATPQVRPQAEMVRERVPAARVEIFEQAGHALFVDESARFNAILEQFVGGL